MLGLLAAATAIPTWTGTAGPVKSTPSLPSTAASRPTVAPCPTPAALTAAQLKTRAQQKLGQVSTRLSASSATRQSLTTVEAGPSGCDAIPGGLAYVHLLQWATDTTIGGTSTTTRTVLFEEQRWRADDASGRVIRGRYPGGNQPTDDSTYYLGQLDGPIGPIAADPTALTAQIDTTQPRFLGPTAVIRGLVSLLGWHTSNQAARTAILTVLRGTPGITYHPSVTDRAGRTGIGVSATADDIRFLLILNPSTGELLAYERAALTPPADSDRNGAFVDD
ncbi:hypothetical protein M8C17_21165 [Micromonospora sp. RHAY321]|uniref:hypothetical protein n=1 Tax=Micromonospora sp. RHAY321 TaxID=2944807 RepID=UPI00207D6BFE|nr:hypothetical protein [Micromonospora sp. RHAY321]MCO1597665.1 hypothetical protein [Micromonospora sp. RHAY321]